jgi:diguanylate cyclase (GGDEF)-like protein
MIMTEMESGSTLQGRADEYFKYSCDELTIVVDRMFAWLLSAEWIGMIVTALLVSPRVWSGSQNGVHPHVWAAILAGPAFIFPAIALAIFWPTRQITRHCVAVAQILVSILLIDITGGRIETHFHVFGSLAFLAFYRDWRVLVTASALTAVDHVVRGIWWSESVYGIVTVSPWRWVEHAWWVAFEDSFLFLSIKRSIQEMKAVAVSKARLYTGAHHDVLTGLANRRLLQESFESRPPKQHGAKQQGQKQQGAMRAVLFLDLDRFKHANDTLGHTVGDSLLKLVASRLATAVAPGDTLARVGGDEFVVLMENLTSNEDASGAGSRLLDALSAPFFVEGNELLLSASVGISLCPEHGTDLSALQERADRAMYVAKSHGRNQCAVFSSEVARHENRMQEIGRDMYQAQKRGELQLYFQPLVERDGQLTGFEALLRWTHPVYGPIAPSDCIPLAEKSGLILAIGDWVLREACRNCKTWQRAGERPIRVAVNVSAIQFEREDFPEHVVSILDEFAMDPSLVTLELTEGVLLRNLEQTRRQLEGLRASGIRISLDDFGTGYSSLSYLAMLPADTIKLDRSFVNREFANASAVLESVIEMAHRVGLRVIGEGVETEAQNDRLSGMDCDELQGFYFSPPMPEEAVVGYIASSEGNRAVAAESVAALG